MATAKKAKATRTKRSSGTLSRRADPSPAPEDRIGFLLALPDDPTAVEVCRLAHEFRIKGHVHVKNYTAPDDDVHFSVLEGAPAYTVTRYPKDMEGCLSRLADRLLERIGRSLPLEAPTEWG